MRKASLVYAIVHLLGALLIFGILFLFAISKIPLFFPLSEVAGLGVACALLGMGYCLWEFFSGLISVVTGK